MHRQNKSEIITSYSQQLIFDFPFTKISQEYFHILFNMSDKDSHQLLGKEIVIS